MSDRIQTEFRTKEEERINRLFNTALHDSSASAPVTPQAYHEEEEDVNSSPDVRMMSDEEKRLATRYLTTDNNKAPPKPKWSTESKSADNTPKREIAGLNVNRPSFQKPSETEKLLKEGLSEQEIIARKKRELEQKAYLKKKKDDSKDLGKWAAKDVEAANKEKSSWEIKQQQQKDAREREIRAAEERRAAEARFQQEREESIKKESNFHANATSSSPKPKAAENGGGSACGKCSAKLIQNAKFCTSCGEKQGQAGRMFANDDSSSPSSATNTSPSGAADEESHGKTDPGDVDALKEERRLKSRWLI